MSELIEALRETLEDERLSRSERKALRRVIEDAAPDRNERDRVRRAAFDEVLQRLDSEDDRRVVRWLERVLSLLRERDQVAHPAPRVYFGPEDPMVETLVGHIQAARRSIDVAVFTLTDDRLARALLSAQGRGVRVRILTDDDKAGDRGSDVIRLGRQGIAVRFDDSPHHFHHKFCVIDGGLLITGSYNWTRGADRNNRENFLVTEEQRLVVRFARAFEALWERLAHG